MFYLDIVNQLTFLIIICFSFLIFAFALCSNKDASLSRPLGAAFFIPFILSCASFLSARELTANALIILAELSLLLSLLVLLSTTVKKAQYGLIQLILFVSAPILLVLVLYVKPVSLYLVIPYFNIPFFIVLSLMCMFFLRKAKDAKALLFWAISFILAENIVNAVGQSNILIFSYISLTFKFAAYLTFSLYFHKESYIRLSDRVIEVEKKLSSMAKPAEMEVKRRTLDIERSNTKLVDISKTDPLTKAYNKTAILNLIESLISSKSKNSFSILMFDIDNFKSINDSLGHVAGDNCIKKLALAAKNSIREVDTLGRYGEDAFIAILPGSTIFQAKLIAEHFRKKLLETESPRFTVSIGIAFFPNDAATVKDLLAFADEGLYMSKKKGNNMISHKGLY